MAHSTTETADVVVVGAGLAGLICSQYLQRQGFRTIVLDKSRGVGGRLATRRIGAVSVDHGLPYWERQGPQTAALAQRLSGSVMTPAKGQVIGGDASLIPAANPASKRPATNRRQQDGTQDADPRVVPKGMTAIAKALASDLTLHRQHRLTGLEPDADGWRLVVETPDGMRTFSAAAVVLAIPAPQISPLLQPLNATSAIAALSAVAFDPCFSVMVGYAAPPVESLPLGLRSPAADLRWVGFEAAKRPLPLSAVVLQSSAEFAKRALDWPLEDVATHLLAAAAALPQVAALGEPQWQQVHRWRYALCRRPYPQAYLPVPPRPLVCCGDWCGGHTPEAALNSGEAAAKAIAAAINR